MNNTIIAVIKSRKSVRTFNLAPISPQEKVVINDLLSACKQGPFGGTIRLVCFDMNELDRTSLKSMGTYGVIRNASVYIGAIVRPGPRIFTDLGFLFEETILHLTARGFGTCWMGGTFTRASFASAAAITGNEILSVISPVGIPHRKRSLMDSAIRAIAGSRNRKQWNEIFFENNTGTPLTPENAGAFARAFECVRIAPSASNKQPWRLIKTDDTVHFFLRRDPGYAKMFRLIDIQSIDIGIALCHFEAAAKESGITGTWHRSGFSCDEKKWEYVVSFVK